MRDQEVGKLLPPATSAAVWAPCVGRGSVCAARGKPALPYRGAGENNGASGGVEIVPLSKSWQALLLWVAYSGATIEEELAAGGAAATFRRN